MKASLVEVRSDIRVADIMKAEPITIRPDATVRELAQLLVEKQITGVPVVSAGDVVDGVVSLWDIARLLAEAAGEPTFALFLAPRSAPGSEGAHHTSFFAAPDLDGPSHRPFLRTSLPGLLDRRRVREIMTPAVFRVGEGASVPELARFLLRTKIHRALVMEGGHLRGIVTSSDVLRAVAGEVVVR